MSLLLLERIRSSFLGFLQEGIIFTITAVRLVGADIPGVTLRVELATMEDGTISKGW
jgi:hypothetical protein